MTATTSPFSAAPSATGYLYQCRYALLLLLQRSREDADAQIAVERFDDISFESDGTPTELIQTKHHLGRPPSLSDGSTDLWKTLRVWSEAVADHTVAPSTTAFTIITCAVAPKGSAAELLRVSSGRMPDVAHDKLVAAATRAKGDELKPAREAFLNLDDTTRRELVRSIRVLDLAPNAIDLEASIRAEIVRSVRREHVKAFHERLEGWWLAQLIRRLAGDISRPVTGIELGRFIDDLRDSFRTDALPIDFLGATPPDLNAVDNRTFVRQLKLIEMTSNVIRWARIDYYRAYSQRSKWVTDNLIILPQLDEYDQGLVEELERERDRLVAVGTPEDMQLGKLLFDHCYRNCRPIRPNCTEPYVGRGSYHMLADRERIGWHPDFKQLLTGKGDNK